MPSQFWRRFIPLLFAMKTTRLFLLLGLLAASFAGCGGKSPGTPAKPVVRIGHFPNITHVQALVAHQLSRQGKGWFEERLGVDVQWFIYNAGPSAMEAIFARSLDVTYVGPSPALNAYSKSKGAEIRVLAGAANGGNALVVRPAANIKSGGDLRGKRIASPQLGNTQDVQLRSYLADLGIHVSLTGGDAFVIPTQNADQLPLFQKGGLDAVWTVEPWVSRLVLEAGAQVLVDDRETNVTLLASSAAFLKNQPELAKKLVAAHCELTKWIQEHPTEAKVLLQAELSELLKATPKQELIDRALGCIVLTNEVNRLSMDKMVSSAQKAGFLQEIPDLGQLFPAL